MSALTVKGGMVALTPFAEGDNAFTPGSVYDHLPNTILHPFLIPILHPHLLLMPSIFATRTEQPWPAELHMCTLARTHTHTHTLLVIHDHA